MTADNRGPHQGWLDEKVHHLPIRIYYQDTDVSGIVYHARYLHFFERGRTESLRALGIHHSELAAQEDALAFAVRRMNVEFVRAAKVDDILVVETLYKPQKGARLMIGQRILRGDEQQHSQLHSAPSGSRLVNPQSYGGLLPACVLA